MMSVPPWSFRKRVPPSRGQHIFVGMVFVAAIAIIVFVVWAT